MRSAGYIAIAAVVSVLALGSLAVVAAQPTPEPTPEPTLAPLPAAPVPVAPPPVPTLLPPPVPSAPPDSPAPPPSLGLGELPDCPLVHKLGRLERETVTSVLVRRGLTIEAAPEGRRLGKVFVAALDVFGPRDSFLRWFNVFHRTTRDEVIQRELVLLPGESWDAEKVDETVRNLRGVLYHSVVVIVPVQSERPGEFDLLMIARDVWSLRFNTGYEVQESQLTFLTLSISENNFLGRRMQAAVVFDMDPRSYAVGPLYVNRNIAGAHLELSGRFRTIFNRDDSSFEGTSSILSFGRPLWSLDTRWGARIDWSHRYAVDRVYRGTGLLTYDAPETPEDDAVPYEYRQRHFELQTSGVRALGAGTALRHRVTLGHELAQTRAEVSADFSGDAVVRDAFERDVLPRSERTSLVFAAYEVFAPRYRTVRNIGTFDLAEDVRLGPWAKASAGVALAAIGSEATFTRYTASAGWAIGLGETGLLQAGANTVLRLQQGELIDNSLGVDLRAVTPALARIRLIAHAEVGALIHETQNRFYRVGGDTGLRAFGVGEFYGEQKLIAGVEARTEPLGVGITRWGLVGFYELGGAADAWDELVVHQDVGVGLRLLLPHLSPELYRFDWAFALDGRYAGWPGRFTAGIRQSF